MGQPAVEVPSGHPLYWRFEERVRERIDAGEWTVGTPIPSERELSLEFGQSRGTTRKALDRLVAEGVLRKEPRRGTYVAEPKTILEGLTLRGFSAQAREAGASPASRLLRFDRVLPSAQLASQLEVPNTQLVYLIERLRSVDSTAVALHQSYVPMNLAPDLEREHLAERSLYEVLASQYQLAIGHAHETLEPSLATDYESIVLGVRAGAPMLLLNVRVLSLDGRPLEVVKIVFRGDRITLRQEI
jgi:GntR family transcriptional regulator